jgi:hypothetical protein
MPRKASDYSKGIQYKIVCKDPSITDCYNGSCVSLKDRKKTHKSHSLNPNCIQYNFKVYRFIRENGGWYNWIFIQLEEFPCKSKQELVLRERYWFDLLKPTLNSYSPTLDVKKMKKTKAEYSIEYNKKNKVEISTKNKQYYEEKKVEILGKQKQYSVEHKDEIAAKFKEKVTCECGCVTNKYYLSIHQKTKKHLHNMDQLK